MTNTQTPSHLADGINQCNACDAEPASPTSLGGYCDECETEARSDD